MKKRMALILVILLLVAVVAAGEDHPRMDAESADAASHADLPDSLPTSQEEAFRLGYAYGYYAALHPMDSADIYILNTHTLRFHYPTCPSAASIAERNRKVFHGTRDQLIEQHYRPCGNCKP